MSHSDSAVLVIGEALIDAVRRAGSDPAEHVGGSPANVAFGLGSLGHDVRLATWFGPDERGARIAAACAARSVRLVEGSDAAVHTSVAQATLDAQGQATYHFDLTWSVPDLAGIDPVGHVHTGSIAATIEPGGTQVLDAVRTLRQRGTVSYDPNMRPTLMGSPDQVRERVEAILSLSDVVKASDEDIQWLYPGSYQPDVLRAWLDAGPSLAVITRGGKGALYAVRSAAPGEVTTVAARPVEVIDTVGAGDSFMAGLVSGLLDSGYLGSLAARERLAAAGIDDIRPSIDRALATSSATVARAGAYAPSRAEIGA